MLRILLSIPLMLAACTPSPQKVAMPDPNAVPMNAASNPVADSPEEALGRRILSTAFVRIGPDGHLTVELRDGRVVILRDVTMRPKDYCGVQAGSDSPGSKYCGGYAEVAAARPGGASPDRNDAAVSDGINLARTPATEN